MKKVLVIGLDSATFDLIMPWIREGRLPNIANMIDGGASGELKSVVPPLSWPAWASFATGKNPGKHGIFDFVERKPGSYNIRTLTRSDILAKSIWAILSENMKHVGVVNVPLMYPPEKVNGIFVSGFGTPDQKSRFTFPPDLRKRLIDDFNYKIDIEEHYKRGSEALFLEDLYEFTENRAKAAIYLMEKYEWDFFMVVFFGTDLIQHLFWGYMDPDHPWYGTNGETFSGAIFNYFQKIDGIIGELLEYADEDTTCIILSDHGHGPLYKKWYVNSWLMKQGLLKLKKKNENTLLSKLGVTRENIQIILKKCRLDKFRELIPTKIKESIPTQYLGLFDVDWSKTKAYALTPNGVFINLKGREPEGIVNPGEEYEEVRNHVIERLFAVEDRGKVIDQVYKREELFTGEYIDKAPDILFSMSEGYRAMSDIYTGNIFLPADSLSGTHKINGILILNGPNVKKGVEIKDAELVDLAPTILHLMNVPIPDDMDGEIINAFEGDFPEEE